MNSSDESFFLVPRMVSKERNFYNIAVFWLFGAKQTDPPHALVQGAEFRARGKGIRPT